MNPGHAIILGAAGAFWFLFIIQAIYFCSMLRGYRRRIDEGEIVEYLLSFLLIYSQFLGYYFAEKLTFGHNGAMVTLTAIHPSNVDLSKFNH